MVDVSIIRCDDYSEAAVSTALSEVINAVGGLSFIKEGMTVVIKANLVTFMKPDSAATTHPEMLCALVKLLKQRGARVIVGDSPGGLYNAAFVNRVYSATGMSAVEAAGAELNRDFSQATADNGEAVKAKQFEYTAYLDKADVIINFCKLKSHGMMGMSAAAKNMFGAVPGTIKPEYHFKYPDADDFANMIVDIDQYFKPTLNIADAVVGMEGNGPTQGKPRHIGAVLASRSPHLLDRVCAHIIGMKPDGVPTLRAAIKRGLAPENLEEIKVNCDIEPFVIKDFDIIKVSKSLQFSGNTAFSKLRGKVIGACLSSKPKLKAKQCIGCNECGRICPAKAIVIKNGKAVIDRKKCIRCFCCQEFCPKGAMKVGRTAIAKLLGK